MAAANPLIRCIEEQSAAKLQVSINNFLATPNLTFIRMERNEIILENGDKLYFAVISYQIGLLNTRLVKIIELDTPDKLQQALNTFLLTLNLNVTTIIRNDIILANGNKSYICTIIYQITTPASFQCKIIEKDNIITWQKAINDYIATPGLNLNPIGVLTNEIILANGNKIYIATIPFNFLT